MRFGDRRSATVVEGEDRFFFLVKGECLRPPVNQVYLGTVAERDLQSNSFCTSGRQGWCIGERTQMDGSEVDICTVGKFRLKPVFDRFERYEGNSPLLQLWFVSSRVLSQAARSYPLRIHLSFPVRKAVYIKLLTVILTRRIPLTRRW